MKIFCFDAETDGLYGEVFAIGAVVMNDGGEILDQFSQKCLHPEVTSQWVRENSLPHLADIEECESRRLLRENFWNFYMKHREGCVIMADVAYPVEADLLRKCVEENLAEREFLGPYPLIDISALFFARGISPDTDRIAFAQAQGKPHNPLDDAIISARCALKLMAGNSSAFM